MLKYFVNSLIFSILYVKIKNTHIMKKQAEKQTGEELRKQLQEALKEVNSTMAATRTNGMTLT